MRRRIPARRANAPHAGCVPIGRSTGLPAAPAPAAAAGASARMEFGAGGVSGPPRQRRGWGPRQAMNYFNYFTEIEEHFQRARGAQIYLSPLDWALIEAWKDAGIPLEAACEGIDQAFAKFANGKRRDRARPRSLAYCAGAVLQAAEAARDAAEGGRPPAGAAVSPAEPGWERQRIMAGLARARQSLAAAELPPLARAVAAEVEAALDRLPAAWAAADAPAVRDAAAGSASASAAGQGIIAAARGDLPTGEDLAALDRWLTALDDRLIAALQLAAPAETLAAVRAGFERELAPHRRNLRAEQLAMVEKQFLHKRLLEHYRLPRFSLFYLS